VLVTSAQEQPSRAEPAKALPEEVVAAWKKAGAKVGWLGLDPFGKLEFAAQAEGLEGAVPAFRLV
jgi:hypothetical protein